MKLALAMICKGSDEEAKMLDICLDNLAEYVDAIYITSTHKAGEAPNNEINKICAEYGANVSYFTWVNDFAKARNFNFSQVPKEYDYILWCDADDTWDKPELLKSLIEENKEVDAFGFWYIYERDEYGSPTVVHKKTQIVRNDGCVEWIGRLHEDFKENRGLNIKFVEDIYRNHATTSDRREVAQKRNVEISKTEAQINPDDPRVYFNLANSYLEAGNAKLAKETYDKFIASSQSEDERYLAYMRLSSVENNLGNRDKAIMYLQLAIGMFPEIPDAYNNLGYLYFSYNMLDNAEKYLLIGLTIKPQYHRIIVYNPRDYDYNPMMALAKVYFNKARPDYALPLLKGCVKIYPYNKKIRDMVDDMEKEVERLEGVIEIVKQLEGFKDDKEKIKYTIDALPFDLQSHPAICRIRNQYFIKTESSGKDIAYYCGETNFDWNPDLFKTKGFGGSEEAVINLSKEWAKKGYNVTVFNSCGIEPMVRDGVTYKPFWHYNPKDRYDFLILWRNPRLVEHDLNVGKIFIDLHDVISAGEFNEKRLKKIDKIFVKTEAHRILFPEVPDDKFAIISNGQDFNLFDQEVEKNPYMLVNTSSPDRSMDVLPKLFKMVKEKIPEARCKWAYGWENFDKSFKNNTKMMNWKDSIIEEMEEAGIEDCGRISQRECAKLYLEGRILAYPSDFYEIDCISVKKAQAVGCKPITTDFAAFKESNQYGIKIKSKKNIKTWNRPYQFHFGIEDEKTQQKWVDAVVEELQKPMSSEIEMKKWAEKFSWDLIAERWTEIMV